MSRKAMMQMALLMAAACQSLDGYPHSRGSYFDTQAAREKDFKVHDKDNDRQLRPFNVKGQVVMAYSKKDAIIRWKHQMKGGKK